MQNLGMDIHRFHTFEDQVAYFTDRTGVHLPRMTYGKGAFFRDLGQWSSTYSSQAQDMDCAHILPDPVQGLSFPRAVDVLSTTLSLSSQTIEPDEIYALMKTFGLPREKATQPVISLSGGEMLLLNFAKTKAMLPVVDGVVACSPIHWLNENSYQYWQKLVDACQKKQRFVDVALLMGEPFIDEETGKPESFSEPVSLVEWRLTLEHPVVEFEEIRFPSYHPASKIVYALADEAGHMGLQSPVLMTGDNGVGKSIFAKLMSGILKPSKGKFEIKAPNGNGYARLIFQDAIDQLFGKSIDGHLNWVFRFNKEKGEAARQIFAELDSEMREYFKDRPGEAKALGREDEHHTLLQAKISLIAERLATRPPVLVLDEPGWALSGPIARKLVGAVCRLAGKMQVAIVLISHHARWWEGMVHTHCHLEKQGSDQVVIRICGSSTSELYKNQVSRGPGSKVSRNRP
jgi:energy-coupling factor transporter ATP-binding protein EcfA2